MKNQPSQTKDLRLFSEIEANVLKDLGILMQVPVENNDDNQNILRS